MWCSSCESIHDYGDFCREIRDVVSFQNAHIVAGFGRPTRPDCKSGHRPQSCIDSSQSLHSLVTRYRANQRGIRFEPAMTTVCLECGYETAQPYTAHGGWECSQCQLRWYRNSCWSCSAPVDSRDPDTPDCPCGWSRCATCHACSKLCPSCFGT